MVNLIIRNEHIVGAEKCVCLMCVLVVTLSRLTAQPLLCGGDGTCLARRDYVVGKWWFTPAGGPSSARPRQIKQQSDVHTCFRQCCVGN